MKEENLCQRAKDIEALFLPRLQQLADKFDVIGDIRGRGAMLAVELVAGGGDKTPNAALAGKVNAYCHSQGLVTLTAGTYSNVFRFLPPLSIGDDLLAEGLDILDQAFAASV
jgi:4-aminobutyrate aminotransferase/(S)-3-amino-2-methylpropionate transaminase